MNYSFEEGAEGVGWRPLSCTWLLSCSKQIQSKQQPRKFSSAPCPAHCMLSILTWEKLLGEQGDGNLVSMSILSLAPLLRQQTRQQLATEIFMIFAHFFLEWIWQPINFTCSHQHHLLPVATLCKESLSMALLSPKLFPAVFNSVEIVDSKKQIERLNCWGICLLGVKITQSWGAS